MIRPTFIACAALLVSACDVTPESVVVCENISIKPALHNAESYSRLHFRIVPSADNTVDVRITFRARGADDRTFKNTEICNFPKDVATSEQAARAHLATLAREKAEAEKRDTLSTEEVQRKYHKRMETRTKRLLKAEDDEGRAILRELQVSRTRFPWTQNWLNRSVQGGPEHDR